MVVLWVVGYVDYLFATIRGALYSKVLVAKISYLGFKSAVFYVTEYKTVGRLKGSNVQAITPNTVQLTARVRVIIAINKLQMRFIFFEVGNFFNVEYTILLNMYKFNREILSII